MHMVIRIIVYASSKEEALEMAKNILENNLVGEDRPFDYYTTFDMKSSVSGRARFGNIPPAVKLMSKWGIKLIDKGWEYTVKDFKESVEKLKETGDKFNWDIEKLMNTEDGRWFKFYCYQAGQYRGSAVWIYDDDGEGIRDIEHLRNAIEKWKSLYDKEGKQNPHEHEDVWVVPVDVHY